MESRLKAENDQWMTLEGSSLVPRSRVPQRNRPHSFTKDRLSLARDRHRLEIRCNVNNMLEDGMSLLLMAHEMGTATVDASKLLHSLMAFPTYCAESASLVSRFVLVNHIPHHVPGQPLCFIS